MNAGGFARVRVSAERVAGSTPRAAKVDGSAQSAFRRPTAGID